MHLQFNILDQGDECNIQIRISEDMTLEKFDDMIESHNYMLSQGDLVSEARRYLIEKIAPYKLFQYDNIQDMLSLFYQRPFMTEQECDTEEYLEKGNRNRTLVLNLIQKQREFLLNDLSIVKLYLDGKEVKNDSGTLEQ